MTKELCMVKKSQGIYSLGFCFVNLAIDVNSTAIRATIVQK
ncbi:hypothetical protein SDC9_161855 [bioreactor metagenome]|uniref:Uncharacterized protein n=1 Tax=bioreactor metagenome TaxID=1076179 RepID=A0A645FJE4_9ZZZZ